MRELIPPPELRRPRRGCASDLPQKIYDGTGWESAATIDYRGGPVSKATGKAVNDITGSFRITPDQARQINWSSSEP